MLAKETAPGYFGWGPGRLAGRSGPPGRPLGGGQLMDRQDIAEQIRFEQELLRHVMEGLRLSTTWQVRGPDASRKLSSLRFVTSSFQRHLERLLALEEDDGFLDREVAGAPHLGRAEAALRAEHDGFRREARRVVQQLEL